MRVARVRACVPAYRSFWPHTIADEPFSSILFVVGDLDDVGANCAAVAVSGA